MLQTYVINLDRHKDRLQTIEEGAKKCEQLITLTRIPAVDGKTLDLSTLPLTVRTHATLNEPRSNHDSVNSAGEIGCYLSHARIWDIIRNGSDPYAMILEDDAVLEPENVKKAIDLWHRVNDESKPTALFLNYNEIFYEPKEYDKDLYIADGRFWSAAAYIINKRAAEEYLQRCYPIEVQVDVFMSFMAKLGKVKTFHSKECLIYPANVDSVVDHDDCSGCFQYKSHVSSPRFRFAWAKRNTWLLIAIAVILALIVIAYFLLRKKNI